MGTSHYREISHPWFSNTDMPLYRWTFPAWATDDELTACLRAREEWGARAQYHVAWVIDISAVTNAPATQRKMFGEHLERFEPHNQRWNTGSGLVVPNAWLRGLVTAVFWFSPPKFPTKIFPEPIEAERWARQQLDQKLADPGGRTATV